MNIYIILVICLSIKTVYSQTSCSYFDNGIDRPGTWYAHIQTTTSADACCALCNAEGTRCQSWVFIRPGASFVPGCYLKQNIPSISESSTCGQYCTSGFKQTSLISTGQCAYPGGAFELGVDRPGFTYARLLSIQSHPACCAMCQMEGDKCRAWTFIRTGAVGKESGCLLKNQIPPISNVPCTACTSGTK